MLHVVSDECGGRLEKCQHRGGPARGDRWRPCRMVESSGEASGRGKMLRLRKAYIIVGSLSELNDEKKWTGLWF